MKPLRAPVVNRHSREVFIAVGLYDGRCGHCHKTPEKADECRHRRRLEVLDTDRRVVRIMMSPKLATRRKWLDKATDADIIRHGVTVMESLYTPPPAPGKATSVVLCTGLAGNWRLLARRNAHGVAYVTQEVKIDDHPWTELGAGPLRPALEAALLESHHARLEYI